jgi:rod shape-determining protein MreD
VKVFWTGFALLGAFLLQSALGWLLPSYARFVDPFLVVVVSCALAGGETHGMLAGAAAGWVQDALFGGRILGLSGLSKVLVAFLVGVAGARFQLGEAGPRALVLAASTLLDALLLSSLASVFNVTLNPFPFWGHLIRAVANAALGLLAFRALEGRGR